MILKAQMQTVGTRQPELVCLWPVRALITVSGVSGIGGDFSQARRLVRWRYAGNGPSLPRSPLRQAI